MQASELGARVCAQLLAGLHSFSTQPTAGVVCVSPAVGLGLTHPLLAPAPHRSTPTSPPAPASCSASSPSSGALPEGRGLGAAWGPGWAGAWHCML